jgi:ubiquinone/menaquinone biosynthesis C-methylase UbiE
MHKDHYYKIVFDYYEEVKNLWGEATNHDHLIEGFKFNSDIIEHIKTIAKLADIKCGQSVLDCGCGFGKIISTLNTIIPANYTGVTLSQYQFNHKQFDNIVMGNYENLCFLDSNTIDRVIFIESFSHAHSKLAALKEAYRVLKKDGKLFILDIAISKNDHMKLITDDLYKKLYKKHIERYGNKPVCMDYVLGLAKKIGFDILETKENMSEINEVHVSEKLYYDIILFNDRIIMYYNYYIFQK